MLDELKPDHDEDGARTPSDKDDDQASMLIKLFIRQ